MSEEVKMDREVEAIGIVLDLLKQFPRKERARIVNYAQRWVNDRKDAPEAKR